jgi:signal transduction histidine kinase
MPPLLTLPLRRVSDVALVREKARVAASALDLDGMSQIRLATAASELARAVIEVGGGGEFAIERLHEGEAAVALIFRGHSGSLVRPDESWDPVRHASLFADSLALGREPRWPVVARFVKRSREGHGVDFDGLRSALQADAAADAIAALTAQNRELADLLHALREREAELQRANVEAAETNQRLQALAHRKDQLLATIAHDLRSPLSAVSGAIDLMVDGGQLTEQQEKFLAIATRATQHIIELVNDLLDSTLLDAGLLRLERQRVVVADVLTETLSTIGFLAEEKGISFQSNLPTSLAVSADPARLAQIVQNLLSNAVKFTSSGGQVALFGHIEDDSMILTVADTGVGMTPEQVTRIFDRDRKPPSRGTRGERGTGLGLTICHHLVELHNGSISVESELGRGTTFRVRLPHQAMLLTASG